MYVKTSGFNIRKCCNNYSKLQNRSLKSAEKKNRCVTNKCVTMGEEKTTVRLSLPYGNSFQYTTQLDSWHNLCLNVSNSIIPVWEQEENLNNDVPAQTVHNSFMFCWAAGTENLIRETCKKFVFTNRIYPNPVVLINNCLFLKLTIYCIVYPTIYRRQVCVGTHQVSILLSLPQGVSNLGH